MSIYITDR